MSANAQQDQAPYRHNTHVLPEMTKEQARKARRLDAPTMFVVLLVIPALLLHFSNLGGLIGTLSDVLNWLIYGWFAFEFFYTLYLAPDKKKFFGRNKLDLFVLVATIPVLPGALQALWVLRLLRLVDMLPALLGRFTSVKLLPYAIVLAFVTVFGGDIAFAQFEGVSLFDGVYFANTTVNTVGYGDFVASTYSGKVLSMVLQWSGNVVLALLIGGVAATAQKMLLNPGSNDVKKELQDVEEEVEDVEEDVQSLLKNAQDLSATDRVILKELENIKRQLEKTNSEG